MRGVTVVILLTFVAKGHGKKTVANHTTIDEDSVELISKLAIAQTWNVTSLSKTCMLFDKLVDKLANKLVDHSLKVWTLPNIDLDDTMLSTAGDLAPNTPRSSLAIAPPVVTSKLPTSSGKAFRKRWGLEPKRGLGRLLGGGILGASSGVIQASLNIIGASLGIAGGGLGIFGASLGVVESSLGLAGSGLGALGNCLKHVGKGLKASKDSGEDSIGAVQRLAELQQQLERECLELEKLAADARSQAAAAAATAEVAQAAESAARSEGVTNAAAAAAARAAAEWWVAESAAAASAAERWVEAAQEAEAVRAEAAAAAREGAAAAALQAETRKEQWRAAETTAAKAAQAEVRRDAFRASESAAAASRAAESAAAAESARETQSAEAIAASKAAERWKTAAREAEVARATAEKAEARAIPAPSPTIRSQRSLPAAPGAAAAAGTAVDRWTAAAHEADVAQTDSAALAAVATGPLKSSSSLDLSQLRAGQPSDNHHLPNSPHLVVRSKISNMINFPAATLSFLFAGSGVIFAVLRFHAQTSQTVLPSLLQH